MIFAALLALCQLTVDLPDGRMLIPPAHEQRRRARRWREVRP